MYTTRRNKVVIMSESGTIMAVNTQMTLSLCLHVTNDRTIFFADPTKGLYQSTDDGVSWDLIKQTYGWQCEQVVKVTFGHSDDFWTLGTSGDNNYRLRVYSWDRRRSDSNMTFRDINVITTNGKHVNLADSELSCYCAMNIFLSDYHSKAVHVFLVNGQYYCQLLSMENEPHRLAVDVEHKLLYVGQKNGVVDVFKLTYGDCDKFLNCQVR